MKYKFKIKFDNKYKHNTWCYIEWLFTFWPRVPLLCKLFTLYTTWKLSSKILFSSSFHHYSALVSQSSAPSYTLCNNSLLIYLFSEYHKLTPVDLEEVTANKKKWCFDRLVCINSFYHFYFFMPFTCKIHDFIFICICIMLHGW